MKTLTFSTLLAAVFALNMATAATPSNTEIFQSLDGEYVAANEVSRTNFAVSAADLGDSVNGVAILKSLDGEYAPENTVASSMSHSTSYMLPKTYD